MMGNLVRLPTQEDAQQAKTTSRVLAKYADKDRLQLKICDVGQEKTEDLIVPGYALHLLLNILAEMAKGNAITVVPVHAELTTQEAASILNVSRPYLINLLEQNIIPFRKVGSHRRVLAEDVFKYKDQVDKDRLEALSQLVSQSQELDMGYN
ncbi:MAG: helix-turn-helix domain-containing protein [Candidatus Thiothrix sulfatifontis]|jgi:excisionase family DNA binding protein|nr:MAG: helix-turn-helix domain-containing protein [Candidatus Thiothrix sulfatifontis]